jgi:outer membrane protein assembly factor BamB
MQHYLTRCSFFQLRELCIVLCLTSWLSGSIAIHGEDWPQWRGVRSNGTWNGPAIALEFPKSKAGLPVVWKVPIGPGYSGISVVRSSGYTMDKPSTPADAERVLCFDALSGNQNWEYVYSAPYGKLDYGSGPRCTPTIHGEQVFTLGAMGHVHCLDARTGAVAWSKDLVRDFAVKVPEWGFAASPVVYRDLVIIHAATERGAYLAFDRLTGDERWRGGIASTGYGTPIVIQHAGSEQLVGWTPDCILGLSLTDGRELWSVPYKVTYGVSIATPIFYRDTIVVCGYWEGSKAIRLGKEPSDARLLWEENRFLRGIMSQPLYRDGHVYLLDKQHGVVCFRLEDGEKVWTDDNQLTRRDRNPQLNMVWLGESDVAICLNSDGELLLVRFKPTGFEELGRTPIIGPTWAHPAFAGDRVYARDDKSLVCVALPLAESVEK